MKLTELVKHFNSEESLNKLYKERGLDNGAEAILVYMEDELSLDSEIIFLPIEDTDDDLVIEREGVRYLQLFPLEFGVEAYSYFKEEFEKRNYTDLERAKRLLQYRMNGA